MNEHLTLGSRIVESLAELDLIVARALTLREKARATGDDDYWDAVALSLHGFYTGAERILEDIARTVDGSAPEGADWHRSLLLQMSGELTQIRPRVISRETRRCLEEFRGFRHIVRHVYSVHLDSLRVAELADEVAACLSAYASDLGEFVDFLGMLDAP